MGLVQKLRLPLYGALASLGLFLPDYEAYAQKNEGIISKPSERLEHLAQVSQNRDQKFEDLIKIQLAEILKVSTIDAMANVGFNGGYLLDSPKKFVKTKEGHRIPLYYDRGEFTMPSLSDIEGEIADYIDQEALKISESKKYIFRKPNTRIGTKVNITNGKVEFTHEVDFQVLGLGINFSGNRLYRFRSRNQVGSRLFEMYQVAKYANESDREDPGLIEVNKLSDMLEKSGLKFSTHYIGIKNTPLNRVSIMDDPTKSNIVLELSGSKNLKDPLEEMIKSDKKNMENSVGPYSFYFISRYEEESNLVPPAPKK